MLYILRHGQTDWNAEYRTQGQTDIPLNDNGRQMARDLRVKYADLSFDICYCSPLQRAVETAQIFLEGTKTQIIYDDRLKEMCFGICEGTANVFEKPDCPIYNLFKDPVHYIAAEKSESFEELYARTGSFIREVLKPDFVESHSILIVGHGAMNLSIINQYFDVPLEHFWDHHLQNGEILRLV